MKSLVSLILFTIIAFGVWLCTSSCTEYEILNTIDTVYIEKPAARSVAQATITQIDTVIIIDTVEVKVIVHDTIIHNIHTTDTLIQVVTKDSIIIKEVEKIVNYYDTIYQVVNNYDTIVEYVTDTVFVDVTQIEQRVIYHDTLYVITEIRPVYSVPDEIQPYVEDFYTLAAQYGKQFAGGVLIVSYVHADDLPGEGWVSESFWIGGQPYGQMYIGISEEIPAEQQRASILREMARLQLKRKYVTDVNKIMSPLFDPYQTITQSDLNVLFNPLPI